MVRNVSEKRWRSQVTCWFNKENGIMNELKDLSIWKQASDKKLPKAYYYNLDI